MNEAEKKKIAHHLTALAELLGRPMSAPAIALYLKAIEDLEANEAVEALNACARESKYFPAPAELRERCGRCGARVEDRGMVEANKVIEAAKRVGGYASVVFDDPVTMAVIQVGFGGWIRLTEELKDENRKWFVMEFAKLYKAYSSQGIKSGGLLTGIFDADNAARGFGCRNEAVMIGDAGRCRDVMKIPAAAISIRREPPHMIEFDGEEA